MKITQHKKAATTPAIRAAMQQSGDNTDKKARGRFSHSIRAAPVEFCLYGFAFFALATLVGGLAAFYHSDGIPGLHQFFGVITGLAYIFGLIPSFFAAGAGPVILLFRRCIWPRRRPFCIYELTLHLIIAAPLMAFSWWMFDIMVQVA